MIKTKKNKIWIDLDNSPHVPFFKPIIKRLEEHGYQVVLTARDCSQTCGLADLAGFQYTRIGHHYGKHIVLKLAGLIIRALQLVPFAWTRKPDLAVSHGSRSMHLTARLLRVPLIEIGDYEHAKGVPFFKPDGLIVPAVIPLESLHIAPEKVHRYSGIKEDVYVPDFKPDPRIIKTLGLHSDDIVVTIRPPASQAHYRNSESDQLFSASVEMLAKEAAVKMVMLPRYDEQAKEIRDTWPTLCSIGKIIIPDKVVDGLNLIWHSDLVISGGGTMNREAAALGVPVYSIFRGKTGAVDRYLAETGRLLLLESVADVKSKIKPICRTRGAIANNEERTVLKQVVAAIENAIR